MLKRFWKSFVVVAHRLVVFALLALALGYLFGGLAFAQDAGPGPFDPVDPIAGAGTAIDALVHGNWWMLASFGTTVAVWALRKYALPKYAENKWVAWGLNLGLSFLVLLIPFLASGAVTLASAFVVFKAWLRDAASSTVDGSARPTSSTAGVGRGMWACGGGRSGSGPQVKVARFSVMAGTASGAGRPSALRGICS